VIRVFLVEDHTLVRQGIRSLLGLLGDVEVVGEACDGEEALARVPDLAPDVLLLDVRLPGRSGLEVLAELGRSGGPPPTLLLTTFDDGAVVLEALRLGAKGYLLKDVSLERLAEAIRAIAAGGDLIQPAVTDSLARLLPELPASLGEATDLVPLTERERAILRLLAGGYSNREVARALGIAEGTVKNHISNLLPKLRARDRTQAVLKAVALKLL
jgi:DNA-binding NarL/FixJ family response regulator